MMALFYLLMKCTRLWALVKQMVRWMHQICLNPPLHAVSFTALVQQRSMNIASTLKKMQHLRVASNPYLYQNQPLKIQSLFCVVSKKNMSNTTAYASQIVRLLPLQRYQIAILRIASYLIKPSIWWMKRHHVCGCKWTQNLKSLMNMIAVLSNSKSSKKRSKKKPMPHQKTASPNSQKSLQI